MPKQTTEWVSMVSSRMGERFPSVSVEMMQGLMGSAASWASFFDTRKMSSPDSVTGARDRVIHNAILYRGNYLMLAIVMLGFSALMRPVLLVSVLVLVALYAYLFLIQPEVGAPWLTTRRKQAVVGLVAFTLFLWFDAFSTLSTSMMATILLACAHASFRKTSDEPDFDVTFPDKV